MLQNLNINNFIIFKHVEIDFKKGLNIFTGETGTGKSLIIDSINLLLGGKSNKNFVRSNCDKAVIQGVFYINNKDFFDLLNDNGIDSDENIIITREIYSNGKSIGRINNSIVPLSFLKTASGYLLDIHGQFEQQSILDTKNHLKILDELCKEEISEYLNSYHDNYNNYISLKNQLNSLEKLHQNKDNMIDYLIYQINELKMLDLKKDEETLLSKEYDLYSNISDIKSSLGNAGNYLSDGDYSVIETLSKISREFTKISKFDSNIQKYSKEVESLLEQTQELLFSIISYSDTLEVDTEKIQYISDKINAINKLKRKYNMDYDSLFMHYINLQNELEQLLQIDEIIKTIKDNTDLYIKKMDYFGNKLTSVRIKAAESISSNIEKELFDLNMKDARFQIQVTKSDSYNKNGIDQVIFKIRTNAGSDYLTLDKILSGGETSRIMIAIKSIINSVDMIPTMIFDEIDSGISGRTALLVGKKIKAISQRHQVICITHSPQIAAAGESNYIINKHTSNNETYSLIEELTNNNKSKEIARLLSGETISAVSIENAEELIKSYY